MFLRNVGLHDVTTQQNYTDSKDRMGSELNTM
jgi:hypothetical protein